MDLGSIDVEARNYLRDRRRFADAFNYLLYDGRQVIDPDALRPLDTAEIAVPAAGKRRRAAQAFRDGMMEWLAMQDDQGVYVVLGAEAQAHIHYAMPVRGGLYDFMRYSDQVEERRRARGEGAMTGDEYLSGFRREDKLKPIITAVIYFGSAEWDGPMCLHDMFQPISSELLRFIPDYKINLIAPARMAAADFRKFRTNFGRVLEFIKYSQDKDKLRAAVNADERYRTMDADSCALIQVATNTKLKMEVREGTIDMCLALEEIKLEGRQEGMREGMREGRSSTIVQSVKNLMRNMGWSITQAMDALSIPAEERAGYAELIKQ